MFYDVVMYLILGINTFLVTFIFYLNKYRFYLLLHLYLDEPFMTGYGVGYCDRGYYAGWDGLGSDSEEECKNLCLAEKQCMFAAYYEGTIPISNGQSRTCSRYNEATCNLLMSRSIEQEHVTFKKIGKLRKVVNIQKQ